MKDICDLFLDFYTNISLQHTHPESKYSRAAEDAGALFLSLEVRSEVLRLQESLRTTQPKHQHQSSSASPLHRSLVCSSLCVLTFTSQPRGICGKFSFGDAQLHNPAAAAWKAAGDNLQSPTA